LMDAQHLHNFHHGCSSRVTILAQMKKSMPEVFKKIGYINS